MQRKGRYSGNERLDPKILQEPNPDSDFTRKLWLEEIQDDEDFHKEVKEKVEKLKKTVAMSMDPKNLEIHMSGESHIDCAWLWRFEQTRQKGAITFRKAVEHAKMFPGKFNFALSEPLLLDWIMQDDPKLFSEIVDTVKNGGIELVGGAYVEPDCMMPSGEAFVRERLYGMRFYNEHFGILPQVEWFLDSFGYNWGLPQILAKSGAKYFWTTKITWNLITTFPFVYFWWEGPDGTKILTANFGMGWGSIDRWLLVEPGRRPLKPGAQKVWNYTYDYEDLDDHVDHEKICPLVGYFSGRGDGGHGPTHQEVAEMMEYEKLGFAKWSKVHTFFDELAKWSGDFPIWQDELYLENHQGTFSVHAEVKRHNRLFENALTSMESLGVLTSLSNPNYKYPDLELEKLWKVVLKDQFHDVLPGSSIPEVYDDCWDDWMENQVILEKMRNASGAAIVQSPVAKTASASSDVTDTPNLLFHNPVTWERRNRIFIPLSVVGAGNVVSLDATGKPPYAKLQVLIGSKSEYICQPIAAEPVDTIERQPAGWWVMVPLKGLSVTPAKIQVLSLEESAKYASQTTIKASTDHMSSGVITVKVDPATGAMVTLQVEGINGGKNLLQGNQSNLTLGFEDTPRQWPAWNLKEEYWKYPVPLPNDKDVHISVEENGPVFATLKITRTLGISPVTQKIMLFAGYPEVFLEYLVDWKQPLVMLKVLYSTTTNANSCISDIAYAAITRSTKPQSPCDKARFEKICHKYFDLSTPDNAWGMALLNEGKYAFDADGGDFRLTMLRSPQYPNPAGESWAYPERELNHQKYNHDVPKYSGLGPFKCRYALLPHNGGALLGKDGVVAPSVKRKAEEFNQPVEIIPVSGGSNPSANPLLGEPLLSIKTPNVYLGALKFNEWAKTGTIIARFVEGSGVSADASVKISPLLASKIKQVVAMDLLERPVDFKFSWDAKSGTLSFTMHKFELCTFELVL